MSQDFKINILKQTESRTADMGRISGDETCPLNGKFKFSEYKIQTGMIIQFIFCKETEISIIDAYILINH